MDFSIKNKKSYFNRFVNNLEQSGELSVEHAKLNLVEQISRAMSHENVTKAELARRLHKSRAYVTQCMQGDVNFTIESLVKIANALNSSIECKFVSKTSVTSWLHGGDYQCVRSKTFEATVDDEEITSVIPVIDVSGMAQLAS